MGEGICREVPTHGTPLVVDWKSEQRLDLEATMRDGIAVVSYDCQSLRLLKECHIEGGYGYMGLARKEDVIQLENADEVRANLPAFGASLTAELSRGSTLDLALLMVGKRRTPVRGATSSDLRGDCGEATHFVRGAYIGAFSMQTGTEGRLKAAAELFGSGADASHQSSKLVSRKDGDPRQCLNAKPESKDAPRGCRSILRVELTQLNRSGKSQPDVEGADCPKGLVQIAGKCTQPQRGVAAVCSVDKPAECKRECDRGNMKSCSLLGLIVHYGMSGESKDVALAGRLYKQACEAGVWHACSGVGVMYDNGIAGFARDSKRAIQYHKQACDVGEPRGCNNLGFAYEKGRGVVRSSTKAVEFYQRACNGGHAIACANLGHRLTQGHGIARNVDRARDLFVMACRGRATNGCSGLAALYRNGEGVPPSNAKAVEFYRRACEMEVSASAGKACQDLAWMFLEGKGVDKSVEQGVAFMERGCANGDSWTCHQLAQLYRTGKHLPMDHSRANAIAQKWCNADRGDACANLGYSYDKGRGLSPDKQRATKLYERGCKLGSGWSCTNFGAILAARRNQEGAFESYSKGCEMGYAGGCFSVGVAYEMGRGVARDRTKAHAIYTQNCSERTHLNSCFNAGNMYANGIGVRRSGQKAVEVFELICRKKDAEACWRAGQLYARGTQDLPRSSIAAASFYKQACDGGYAKGCNRIARAYRLGEGVPQDPKQEEEYRRKACVAGDLDVCRQNWADEACTKGPSTVCYGLGLRFVRGTGGFEKSRKKATDFFSRGCERLDAKACNGVGEVHLKGLGVRKSKKKAVEWFAKACRLGDSDGCSQVERLNPR